MPELHKINGKMYVSDDGILFRPLKKTPKLNWTPEEEIKYLYFCALKMKAVFGEQEWHRIAIHNYETLYKPVCRKARRKVCRCTKRK